MIVSGATPARRMFVIAVCREDHEAEVCDHCELASRLECPFQQAHRLTIVQENMLLMECPRFVKLLEHVSQAWEHIKRDQSPLPVLDFRLSVE